MTSEAASVTPLTSDTAQAGDASVQRVAVLLPLPLAGAYDYAVPDELELAPGDFVAVPLGSRVLLGVVWDRPQSGDEPPVAASKLKPVAERIDTPPMPAALRRFILRVARYTMSPPGAVLRMAMSAPTAFDPPRPAIALRRTDDLPPPGFKPTPGRGRVLALLEDGRAMRSADLAREAGVSTGLLRAMIAAGVLAEVELPEFATQTGRPFAYTPPTLSPAQGEAAASLVAKVTAHCFSVTLLDGVTGAGKTEVYFAAIAACLAAGRQALVLLPEIALSAQWLDRFDARFGALPVLWHSGLASQVRRRNWRRIARGVAPVVVGARSALFLPLDRLGLVVVDEEHDHSFKQEDGVLYHARDMAVLRAQLADAPAILASATPSLETVANVASGRYAVQRLPDRHGADMPEIQAIDLRRHPPPRQRFLSPPLVAALGETLAAGRQAMLFLNRRGYAPLTLCRTCGHRFECPNCSAWLVEHRLLKRLVCHHCGQGRRFPDSCPSCGETDSLAACGPGVERLGEEAAALFPDARRAIMASDQLTGPQDAADLVRAMEAHEIDLLIGTQMVAKGHNFPGLALVGVVDADLGLGGGDLRAGERTYQLLHQVAGRAGRAGRGRVLLQTTAPDHPVIAALVAADRDAFYEAESEQRRRFGMPPFGRLAALILSSPDPDSVDRVARLIARAAPHAPDISVLGPAPAPLSLLRGRHRRRLLLKTGRDRSVQAILHAWLSPLSLPTDVRLSIDIDPYSFM
jgi:primosomal protein N' (replication factor Y)